MAALAVRPADIKAVISAVVTKAPAVACLTKAALGILFDDFLSELSRRQVRVFRASDPPMVGRFE